MDASVTRRLTDDLEIRLITAPFFLATKLEAFQGRGQRDFFASQDLEDVITVVDGRASLVTEIRAASVELRAYIRDKTGSLLAAPEFLDALPGYLLPDAASQARISTVLGRLEALALL